MRLQRQLLVLVTALVCGSPTLGQEVASTASGSGSLIVAETVPDFSGIWGHLSLPAFEPPLYGPGPVTSLNGVASIYQLVGDYTNPILKPHAAEVVKKYGEIELSGHFAPNPANQCWPGGVPFVFWNLGMQMLQQPDKITFLYSNNYEVRRVRMNEQHPVHVTPSWYGDSVGHYEGDTLVVDTVGIRVGPHAMVDWYGTPHTEALHVVERYRLLDYTTAKAEQERGERINFRLPANEPGFGHNLDDKEPGLQLHITVDDDGVFATPWTATVTYRRPLLPFGHWPEVVCADNRHVYYMGVDTAVPQADKPDF
jgi:hypothetical protein